MRSFDTLVMERRKHAQIQVTGSNRKDGGHRRILSVFLRGLILGFSIAAPVGPIGVLCIRRTLADGRVVGFISGLGAATADAMYGCIAAFGLTFISSILVN